MPKNVILMGLGQGGYWAFGIRVKKLGVLRHRDSRLSRASGHVLRKSSYLPQPPGYSHAIPIALATLKLTL